MRFGSTPTWPSRCRRKAPSWYDAPGEIRPGNCGCVRSSMAYDEALAGRVRLALRGQPGIAERKMFGGVAFLRNGRMCCGVVGQDLVVRVIESDMEKALRERHVRPMDFTGRPMRGFVYVSR